MSVDPGRVADLLRRLPRDLPIDLLAGEIVKETPGGLQMRQAVVLGLNGDGTAQIQRTESTTVVDRARLVALGVEAGDTVWNIYREPDPGIVLGGSSAFQAPEEQAALIVRKNSGIEIGPRRRANLIEGSDVTITVADDPTDDEIDITLASTAGGGGGAANGGPRMRPDLWYSHHAMDGANLTQMFNGNLHANLLLLANGGTVKALGISVQTAGSADALVRLGIYRDNGFSYPGTRLLDAGTVAASTTGIRTISFANLALTADWYWLVAVLQGSPATRPVVRGFLSQYVLPTIGAPTAETTIITQWEAGGVTGVLPDPYPAGALGRQGGSSVHIAVQSV